MDKTTEQTNIVPQGARDEAPKIPEHQVPEPQNKKVNREKVAIIILVAIICIILGLAGWVFIRHQHKTASPVTKVNTSQTNNQVQTTTHYLTLNEWGVKMKISNDVKDAYYVPATNSTDTVWLGLKSLDSKGCAAALGNSKGASAVIGAVVRVLPTDIEPVKGVPYSQSYPGATVGGYYYAYISHPNNQCASTALHQSIDTAFSSAAKSTVASQDVYAGWKTYASSADHFSVEYPSGWTLDAKSAQPGVDAYDSATLTSPSKTVLHMYANAGGKGGGCEPGANDVPFKQGNTCPTIEYLSSDRLPVDNLYYATVDTTAHKNVYTKALVYMVTTHYADPRGVPLYGISIAETTTPENTFALNTPYMGSVIPNTFLTVYSSAGKFYPYVYVYAIGDSPSFLTSNDITTIKNIMRSFKLDL